MKVTRRDVGKLALAALPGARMFANPNSSFGGVHIGINAPYSFHGTASSADEILQALVQLGLSTVELRSQPVEAFLGAPDVGRGRFRRRRTGDTVGGGGQRETRGGGPEPAAVQQRRRGRGRAPLTPEQQATRAAATEELRKWRLSTSMVGFKAFRKKYEDEGVTIDIVKFDRVDSMTDDELDYSFEVANALGARFITCEPPRSHTKRIGAFAEKHKMIVGYHGHADVTGAEAFGSPQSWEEVMSYSKYNGANVDIGHFIAGNGFSPAEFIRKHHGRITNLHLKDRKKNQGPNVPWGEGDTPIREILQLMKKEKYDFMAAIEMEHRVPEGSEVMVELTKCIQFCRDALG